MYEKGIGVKVNQTEAAVLYNLAADKVRLFVMERSSLNRNTTQGYAHAQYNLGIMYTHGRGVPQVFNDQIFFSFFPKNLCVIIPFMSERYHR